MAYDLIKLNSDCLKDSVVQGDAHIDTYHDAMVVSMRPKAGAQFETLI